jgi:hypothetical protein
VDRCRWPGTDGGLISQLSSEGADMTFLVPPHEICGPPGMKVDEADLVGITRENPRLSGNQARERWVTMDTGDTVYLIRASAWPDLFEVYEQELDIVLHSFRFEDR